jgi:hypothetical protein
MIDSSNGYDAINSRLARIQRNALIAGAVGLLLVVVGVLVDLDQVFQSYLFTYLFWLGISLGCLVWMLIHGMTGGRWGDAIHPLLEASAYLVVLMALLFIPLLFGLDRLYLWARPDAVANDALLQHKQPYLNIPFFIGRAIFYFVVWAGTILLLARWWRRLIRQPSVEMAQRVRRFSGIGLAIYGITVTFGAIDWLMSLDPFWFSTIFGVVVAAGQASASLAFASVVIAYIGHLPPFSQMLIAKDISDLGNLLLTAVIFWTYITFVQFFIIWSGNLPEEVLWYLHRLEGGWNWVPIALIFFHFIVPFVLLLSGRLKRDPRRLAMVALMILAADLLHLFWLVEPTFSAARFSVHWLDIVMPFFLGGLWIAAFVWRLRRQVDEQPSAIVPASE